MLKQQEILVGRYQIVKHLGSGGFTETYLAEDKFLPEKPLCVVKQLRPRSLEPETLKAASELFETEAQVLDKLGNHDQIPRLLAYFEENQEFYLIEEFTDGDDLDKQLAEAQKLSEEKVITLQQEILSVLKFVHQQNVIHRDIKPSNIIRRRSDGKIVLTGFGAVKQVHTQIVTSEGETSFTIPVGTRGYMPYEQQGGKPRFSSDIYALGMTAIQALTGIHPCQLIENPQTGEISWRSQARVSDGLATILDKMVKSHYRDRYQTADEALDSLRNLSINASDNWGTSDFSSGSSAVTNTSNRRRKLLVPVSIGALIVIIGVIFATRNLNLVGSKPTPPPVTPINSTQIPSSTPEPTTAEDFVQRGNQRLDTGEYKDALADFEKATQLQPNLAEALSGKTIAQGWLIGSDNKFKEALATFEKAIEIQQNNPRAWSGKGDALLALYQYQDALAAYDKATQIAPDFVFGWVGRGQALTRLEKYEDAIAAYDKAIQIDSKNAFTWSQRGDILRFMQKHQEAIQSYDKALEINNSYLDAWIGKGYSLFQLGKREEGLQAIDKAIEINSNYADAWLARGFLLGIDSRHEGELAAYEKALGIDAKNVYAWLGKSQALLKLRRLDEAIIAADEALKLSPNVPQILADVWNVKANALYESEKYDQALPAYKKVVELAPKAEFAWSNLSEILNRMKKYSEALAAADKALNIKQIISGWNQRANALIGLGKYLDAIAAYNQVIQLKPDYHYAWVGKGNAFYKLGKYEDAIAAYDKAIEIQPQDRKLQNQSDKFNIWNLKGNALFQLKKYDEALAAYQEAVKIKPDFAEGYFNQGRTLETQQKYQEALAAYDKALGIKKDFSAAQIKRDEVAKRLGVGGT